MKHMEKEAVRGRLPGGRWVTLTLALGLFSSCGAGVAGVVASSGSSGGGNSAASIANLQVPVSRTSPARIRFELSDREGETVRVELLARVASMSDRQLLTAVSGPDFPANGAAIAVPAGNQIRTVDVDWRFQEESFLPDDGRLVEDVELVARLESGAELVLGDDEPLSLGNDAPVVAAVTPIVDAEEGEAAGIVRIQVGVGDSSDDVVTVVPEFDVQGDAPDAGWRPATGFGLSNVRVSRDGTALDFFWDTDADLRDLEREVLLRFTPTDFALVGPAVESVQFRVDNNAAPIVQLDSGPLILNPDERRGIPIPFRVIDEEGDLVEVIFQWRHEGEEFRSLDRDGDGEIENAEIDEILADEELRQEHHICTPYPHYAKGRVVPIDEDTVRLPELASSESWILASGIVGKTLELLRPVSIPAPITPTWRSNPLVSPIAALPVGDGLTALVLDVPGNGRLREIELATGAIVREIATLGPGIPSAMAFERREKAVLVALDDAGTWRIERVELATGAITELIVSDGTEPAPVRGIASLGTNATAFTAGSSLFHLDYRDVLVPQLGRLLTGLAAPWGVAVDPLPPDRLYVSERDANRVLAIELDSHDKLPVVVRTEDMQPATLEAPVALALERHSSRMLIVTSAPGGGQELLGLDIGATGGNVSYPIGAATPVEVASVATGPDGLRLLCLPTSDELLVAGGIEQRRAITTHSTSSQDVTVEPPLDLVPAAGQPWRIPEESHRFRASAQGVVGRFLWNSADAHGGHVFVRAYGRDDETGVAADGAAAKNLRSSLDVVPLTLGGSGTTNFPVSVAMADLDGDGDQDPVSANKGGDNLTIFFQISQGTFVTSPLVLPVPGGVFTGSDPVSVGTADFDDDGDQDLVSANLGGDNLTIFFQEPAASFASPPLVLGGGGTTIDPMSVATGDLDGDGDMDVVSANSGIDLLGLGDSLTVFFQEPSGTFATRRLILGSPSTTNNPRSIAAADLDGDGDLDLVSGNSGSGTMTVFFQEPAGRFASTPLVLPFGGGSVATADLDGDSDQDLVVAGGDLTLFLQEEPGFFTTPPLVLDGGPIASQLSAVATADIDGDDDMDLVSSNSGNGGASLAVFIQELPGSFASPPLAIGSFSFAQSLAAADMDGDGDMDVVSANLDDDSLTAFLQESPGEFKSPTLSLGGPTTTPNPLSVAAADLDGDGDLDLVSANQGDLTVFFQPSPGTFASTPLALRVPGGAIFGRQAASVVGADLDGDGDLDLVSANLDDSSNLTVFFQDAPGSFANTPLILGGSSITIAPIHVETADLDQDGDMDLVCANSGGNNLKVFFQGPSGSFASTPLTLGRSEVTLGPSSVTSGDLDSDGDQDLVSANFTGRNLTVFAQESPGSFRRRPPFLTAMLPRSATAADLDGDGDLDLGSANSSNLAVFFQESSGSFLSSPLVLGGPSITLDPQSVIATDLDGDGRQDLVSANKGGNNLTAFLQGSAGTFGSPSLSLDGPPMGGPVFVAAADLDGDGDVDLISANGDVSNLTVFWGGR